MLFINLDKQIRCYTDNFLSDYEDSKSKWISESVKDESQIYSRHYYPGIKQDWCNKVQFNRPYGWVD